MACYDFLSIFVVFGGPTGFPEGLKKEKRNKKEKRSITSHIRPVQGDAGKRKN